jgi:hypothetical protein
VSAALVVLGILGVVAQEDMLRLPGYAIGVPIEHDRRQPHEVGEHGPDVDAGGVHGFD